MLQWLTVTVRISSKVLIVAHLQALYPYNPFLSYLVLHHVLYPFPSPSALYSEVHTAGKLKII